jgi:hypothetical protein
MPVTRGAGQHRSTTRFRCGRTRSDRQPTTHQASAMSQHGCRSLTRRREAVQTAGSATMLSVDRQHEDQHERQHATRTVEGLTNTRRDNHRDVLGQ